MLKAFISFCSEDDSKMESLIEKLRLNDIDPIVIVSRKEPAKTLSEKVIKGIEDCEVFIPILTKNSIYNQWVNQEIGYAFRLLQENETLFYPIVDKSILDELNQFINKQMDLSFNYDSIDDEKNNFEKTSMELIEHIKSQNIQEKNRNKIEAYLNSISIMDDNDVINLIKLDCSITLINKCINSINIKDINLFIPIRGIDKCFLTTNPLLFSTKCNYSNNDSLKFGMNVLTIKPFEKYKYQCLCLIGELVAIDVVQYEAIKIREQIEELISLRQYIKGKIVLDNNEFIDIKIKLEN